ncbi:MAG: glycosyltransferase family 2 protein [Solirubrobacterales bacterium]|nr:glycosyltransferase family 2 protein [Solirubrobacterales bacterium]
MAEPSPEAVRTLVFVPAWNEENSVAQVVTQVRERVPGADLLVVDDGSTDRTAERARGAGAMVASLPFNQGLGAALQTGYLIAQREGYEYCAHLDADGQHPPQEAARLLEAVWHDQCDLAIGSRYRGDGGEGPGESYRPGFARGLGIRFFRFSLSLATHQRFTDTTSGLRASNRRAIELFAGRYAPDFGELESLQRAVRQGLRIKELQVTMLPREKGSSFLTPLKSAFFIFKGVIVLVVGRFRPRDVEEAKR